MLPIDSIYGYDPLLDPAFLAYRQEYENIHEIYSVKSNDELKEIIKQKKVHGFLDGLMYALDPVRRADRDAAEEILEKRLNTLS